MPNRTLHAVRSQSTGCRTVGCTFEGPAGKLGFCGPCYQVYLATQELRRRVLDRRQARLKARHRPMLEALSPRLRDQLLGHMAAQCDRDVPAEHGLNDFLAELHEAGGLT